MPSALRLTDRASSDSRTRSTLPSAPVGAPAGAPAGASAISATNAAVAATTPPATRARPDKAARAQSPRTDRARLRAAFRALRGSGVLARQGLECCSTCALAALRDLLLDPADARSYDGYVYYTQPDHRAAAAGAGLSLRYGSASGTRADTSAIGARIIDALVAAGLHPEWSGQPEDAIDVPLAWTW